MRYWDPNWNDEEWLSGQTATTLRYIYKVAEERGDKADAMSVVVKLLDEQLEEKHTSKGFADETKTSEADILAYTQHTIDNENAENTAAYTSYRNDLMLTVSDRMTKLSKKYSYIIDKVKFVILGKAAEELGGTGNVELQAEYDLQKANLENTVKNLTDALIERNVHGSDSEVNTFIVAEKLGILDSVSQTSKDALYARFAELAGLQVETTPANDGAMESVIKSTEVAYDASGNLSGIYADCNELYQKIHYNFPDDTSDEEKDELTADYDNQMLTSASHRAAQVILQNRAFLLQNKTEEEIMEAYKKEVNKQYRREVVLAGLADDASIAVMMDNIEIDEYGNVSYTGEDATAISKAIDDILDGKKLINPEALEIDHHMLNKETDAISKELKLKRIDENKLSFWQKSKREAKLAADNIINKGGWKKVGINIAVFGLAGFLQTRDSVALNATGAVIYALGAAANAWVGPVWDLKEQKGISFREAWKEKMQESDFKKHAWIRTAGGLVTAGSTFAANLFDISKKWKRRLRVAVMALGKVVDLGYSHNQVKKREKELAEAENSLEKVNYSIENFRNVKDSQGRLATAKSYRKQAAVSLGAVVLGGLIGEGVNQLVEKQAAIATTEEHTSEGNHNGGNVAQPSAVADTAGVAQPGDSTANYSGEGATGGEVTEAAPEPDPAVDYDSLNHDHQQMYDNITRKFGATERDAMFNRIQGGKFTLSDGRTFDLPEGMDKVQALDASQRLTDWIGKKSINAKILAALFADDCDKINSYSDAQIARAISTLQAIDYNHGVREVMVNGCPVKQGLFGSLNLDKYNELSGEHRISVPVAKYSTHIDRDGCPDPQWNPTYKKVNIDCGCEEKFSLPNPTTKTVTVENPVNVNTVSITEHPEEVMVTQNRSEIITFNTQKAGIGAADGIPETQIANVTATGKETFSFTNDQGETLTYSKNYSFSNNQGNGSFEVKDHYNEGNGDCLRLWLTGDFDADHGSTGGGKQVNMSVEAFDRLIENNPLQWETTPAQITDQQWADLHNVLQGENPPVTYDTDASATGNYDDFNVKGVDGVDNVKLVKPVEVDLANTAAMTLDTKDVNGSTLYVLHMKDVDGKAVTLSFNNQGNCTITNAAGINSYIALDQQETFNEVARRIVADSTATLAESSTTDPATNVTTITKTTTSVNVAAFNTGYPEGSTSARLAGIAAEARGQQYVAANQQVVNDVLAQVTMAQVKATVKSR